MKHLLTMIMLIMCTINTYAITYENSYKRETEYLRSGLNPSIGMYSTSYYREGRPKVRKVVGYTENGDSINTDDDGRRGNPNPMWEDGYSYYYYGGYWYRNKNGEWRIWNTPLGWGWLAWGWQGSNDPGKGKVQYYEENPAPIGYSTVLYVIAGVYIYRLRRKKQQNC